MRMRVAALVAVGTVFVGSTAFGVATAYEPAERGPRAQITDTLPPPTAEQVCNSQQYGRQLEPPTERCFRAIAYELGWTFAKTDSWVPFVITADNGVLYGESEHCPNRRGGDWVRDDCTVYRCANGRGYPTAVNQLGQAYCEWGGDDVGFGQVTCVLYGPVGSPCTDGHGGVLCLRHGYCSSASVLASPYHSMKVVLHMIDVGRPNGGSDPWCYDADARRYHRCNAGHVPDR